MSSVISEPCANHHTPEFPSLSDIENKITHHGREPMDVRLFAHIHLDSEIYDSSLEGGTISKSAVFLSEMIETYSTDNTIIPQALKDALKDLKEDTWDTIETLKTLRSFYEREKKDLNNSTKKLSSKDKGTKLYQALKDKFLNQYNYENLVEKINNLQQGQSLSVNGGYSGLMGEPGHAVLYRFSKDSENKINIEIFNTGDGCNNHLSAYNQPLGWVQCKAKYQLENKENLKDILQQMAIIKILPPVPKLGEESQYREPFKLNIKNLYELLKEKCQRIELEDKTELVTRSYVGQQSGTCSFRVFTPFIKNFIKDKDTSDSFRLYYKIHSIYDFYHTCKAKNNLEDWGLLVTACQKLMRIIRKKTTCLDEATKKNVIKEVTTIIHKSNQQISALKKTRLEKGKRPEDLTAKTVKLSFSYEAFSEIKKSNQDVYFISDIYNIKSIKKKLRKEFTNKKIPLEQFKKIIDRFLSCQNISSNSTKIAIEQLAKVIIEENYTVDCSDINQQNITEKFIEIEKLSNDFKALCIKKNSHNTPINNGTLCFFKILDRFIREATPKVFENTIPPYVEEGLYEICTQSCGYLEKKDTDEFLLKTNNYDKTGYSNEQEDITQFHYELEAEIFESSEFKAVLKEYESDKNINPRELLRKIFHHESHKFDHEAIFSVKISQKSYDAFIRFILEKSKFGIYKVALNLLQKITSVDNDIEYVHLKKYWSTCIAYKPSDDEKFKFDFKDKRKFFDDSQYKHVFANHMLNQSQILTQENALDEINSSLLKKVAKSLSVWPKTLINMHKKNELNTDKYNGYCDSMILEEHEILNEFLDNQKPHSDNLPAFNFTGSDNQFHSTLEYFLRFPEKLQHKKSQVFFMMGIFGGSGKNLENISDNNLEALEKLIKKQFIRFQKEKDGSHGIFIVEALCQLQLSIGNKTTFSNALTKILDDVIISNKENKLALKKCYCIKLILAIDEFKQEFSTSEDEINSLIDLISINKKQISLSSEQNYYFFHKASERFYQFISQYVDKPIISDERFIKKLFSQSMPLLSNDMLNKIAKGASISFPSILYYTENYKDVYSYNLLTGCCVKNTSSSIKISEFPEEFSLNCTDAEYNHTALFDSLIQTNKKVDLESHNVDGDPHTITAKKDDLTFYFQKNKKGKPIAFMSNKPGEQSFFLRYSVYQKKDIDKIEDETLRRLYSHYPDTTLWVDLHENTILLDKNMQQIFATTNSQRYRIKNHVFENELLIQQTEDENQFIILTKNIINQDDHWWNHAQAIRRFCGDNANYKIDKRGFLSIELLDYQQTLSEGSNGNLYLQSDKNLFLEEKQLAMPAALTFKNQKTNKSEIFLPNIHFVMSKEDGYFKSYYPDIHLSSYKNKDGRFHKLSQKRAFFRFELDENDYPIAKTPEEMLFLANYQMHLGNLDIAFDLIKTLRKQHPVNANFATLELLVRILNYEPFNEKILAIKTQALLIATNIKVGKKIVWQESDKDTLIGYKTYDEVKKFFNDFPNETCQKTIIHYIRNISQSVFPECYRVSNHELDTLLTFDMKNRCKSYKKLKQWHSYKDIPQKTSQEKTINELDEMVNIFTESNNLAIHSFSQFQKIIMPYKDVDSQKFNERNSLTKDTKPNASIKKASLQVHSCINGLLQDNEAIKAFSETLDILIIKLHDSLRLKESLLNFCQELQYQNQSLEQAIISSDIKKINLDDILGDYLRDDKKRLASRLGLTENDPVINDIFKAYELCLQNEIYLNRCNHLHKTLKKISPQKDMLSWLQSFFIAKKYVSDEDKHSFIEALNALKSNYTLDKNNRSLLLFEVQEGITLRKEQIESIHHVLSDGNENTVVQFIMGGGKTSVFLPIAAMKMADGDALSIVIVPESLLSINEKQLDNKTAPLFAAKSQTIHFDRLQPVTEDSLKRLLDTLKKTIVEKGYLITSKETLQAIELSYIENLKKNDSGSIFNDELTGIALFDKIFDENSINEQVVLDYFEEILSLFRNKGKAIIDEVDSVLYIRKEFNFSAGKQLPIDKHFIFDSTALYKSFIKLNTKANKDNIADITNEIISDQLSNNTGLISELRLALDEASFDNLLQYIKGDCVSTSFYEKLNDELQQRTALLKHQITTLLPSTLLQEQNVSYGPSKKHKDRHFAIPYIANNIPAETSRFSCPFETLNLTIQLYLQNDLSTYLVKDFLIECQNKSFNESLSLDNSETPYTSTANIFEELTGIPLENAYRAYLDNGNVDFLMKKINAQPKKFNQLKFHLLENVISQEIVEYPEAIKSDTISFIDQLHSSIGTSGTVQNHPTYHQRLTFAASLNPETDGKTITILKNKNCPVEKIDRNKITIGCLSNSISKMLSNPNTRAIIDIGALFSGISGKDIASALAIYLKETESDIKYILYYDEDSQLWAKHIESDEDIYCEKTDADYLEKKLGITAANRFTYYDQSHATGSDISQMKVANAIATIGENTTTRDLVQGVMRMRGFAKQQTISFMAGGNLRQLNDIHSLIDFCQKRQDDILLEDNYRAALKKISATIRNEILNLFLSELKKGFDLSNKEEKKQYYLARKNLFNIVEKKLVQKKSLPLELFKEVKSLQQSRSVLRRKAKHEIQCFEEMIISIKDKFSSIPTIYIDKETLINHVKDKLEDIINLSIENCSLEVFGTENQVNEQVEVQAQDRVEHKVEEQQQVFLESVELKSELPIDWKTSIPTRKHYSLNKIHPAFSSNIYLSRNYGYLRNIQKKPTLEIENQRHNIYCLYQKQKNSDKVSCTLLTSLEKSQFLDTIDINTKHDMWIEMPSGKVVCAGNKPENIKNNSSYLSTREQIQFFHGDIDLLLEPDTHHWLGTLSPREAHSLTKQILSNPLFIEKQNAYNQLDSFFDTQLQCEIPELFLKSSIHQVTSLLNAYIEKLETEYLKLAHFSPGYHLTKEKINTLKDFKSSIDNQHTLIAKYKEITKKVSDPNFIKIIKQRRYVPRSIFQLGSNFLASIGACLPFLLDILTFGKIGDVAGKTATGYYMNTFFNISGESFIDELNKQSKMPNKASSNL